MVSVLLCADIDEVINSSSDAPLSLCNFFVFYGIHMCHKIIDWFKAYRYVGEAFVTKIIHTYTIINIAHGNVAGAKRAWKPWKKCCGTCNFCSDFCGFVYCVRVPSARVEHRTCGDGMCPQERRTTGRHVSSMLL